jgi:glutamyl-tRNA synthetase
VFGFKKRKEKKTEDEIFDDLIGQIDSIDNYQNPKKIEHYILDSCEQIIAATKDIEGKKAEIKVLTNYLEDIRRIGRMNKKEACAVKRAAAAIEKAQKSRRAFMDAPKPMSDDAYKLIQENEGNIGLDIQRMKENEAYQEKTSAKMHVLEADKGELHMDFDEATGHSGFAQKICWLLLVLFVATFFILLAAGQSSSGQAAQGVIGVFLLVFALLAVILFLWQASTIRKRRGLLRDLNSTINSLNVARMEYANVTKAINATSDKYHVHSATELEYLYNSYLDFNDRREKFVKDDEDLTYWNSYLMKLLSPLRLYDPHIWEKQAAALNHEDDMKEVHDELVKKRQDLRDQIELERDQVKSDREQIDEMMAHQDFYVPEILEILKSVDRLCGLDTGKKLEENSKMQQAPEKKRPEPKPEPEKKPEAKAEGPVIRKVSALDIYNKEKQKEVKPMKVRTRFAPSPTGRMHVGNLRTALYAFLIAKHAGGDFILRIEDTDQERYVDGAIDIIYKTLKDTGLTYDEGPDKDGGVGPYVQSERVKQGIYMKYAKELIDKGEAYYCFCTPERLEGLKQEVVDENGEKKTISIYDKHCLHLSKEEVEANLAAGKPYVIRQNNPRTGTTTFHDEIYGDITVDNSELDDMILIKSDGYPTYNFANVVDDHLMGITHVVRGNEYLSSSPKYNRLYEAFGWEVPKYIHCPLITNEEHQKLSKRSGHSSFEDLVEQGYLTDAIVNFVALLGWSPEDNQEIMNLPELIEKFDYTHINKSPAVFDITKLKWMNGEYIKRMDPAVFNKMAMPYIDEVVKRDCDKEKIAALVQSRIEIFPDIKELVDFFEAVPEYDTSLYINKKNKCTEENSLALLEEVLPVLEAQDDYSNDGLFAALKALATDKGYKVGFVMWPLRTALSGKASTPGGATQIMEILGKDESLSRIRAGIDKLKG